MSAIFKEYILPKIHIASLDASETKAFITVLELVNATHLEVYTTATNSTVSDGLTANFTANLAQQIYFHPSIYANEQHGLEFIISWLPLLEHGFYPDEKSTNTLVKFLKFSLSYLQSDAISDGLKTQLFLVLKTLVHSTSKASLPITRFLIDSIFDIRDVLNSDFLIQQCLQHQILVGQYTVTNSEDELSAFPFKIDTDFIAHFFDTNWYTFISKFHHMLPVGRVYVTGAYDLMLPWFSNTLATFYKDHLNVAIDAHHALKERLIFGEVKSLELLNIKTSDNNYPLINALASKVWDAGDVLLFNNRDKAIPQDQLDNCYLRFIQWLSADGGSHFYTEAFKDYGIHILSDNTAEALPLQCIPFWFDTCHPKTGIASQTETYNTLFSKLLIEDCKGTLPVMRYQNQEVQVTGAFLIKEVFLAKEHLKTWLQHYLKLGLKNPLNQFLVRTFFDAREVLSEIYTPEQQNDLQVYLLELAYSARDTNQAIKAQHMPCIANTLFTLCVEPGNFTRVNEIWALKNLDDTIVDLCNQFARKHYINENRPLNLSNIQAWFNYLGDYYYSYKQEGVWVTTVLTTQGVRTATYFNAYKDDVGYFLDRLVKRVISFHKRCKQKETTNTIFTSIATEIETYLSDFLGELMPEKLHLNTITYLYEYSNSDDSRFSSNDVLYDQIESYSQFVLNSEASTAEKSNPEHATESVTIAKNTDDAMPLSDTNLNAITMNQHYIKALLTNLETYKDTGVYETKLLAFFNENIEELKTWLSSDETGMENRFSQALYMALLDTNLAPGTDQDTYGTLCRSLFAHIVKGTKMSTSYGMGLQAMAKSGAYSTEVSTALLQVVDDLNA
ncbi:hypothetical protein [Formosa algae]|uniref:Uncharacterized protein n=1 Tax=Formosa algae TaxID=225843 RepID=A0A9X1CCR1_9FLAO|nr:hypothetical protein [Formosa algae]MBP1840545.1 hypothetical protein [Formosa algae]MDQ0336042.1 hypothetical protein [Formosa algae]OEI81073.1 hypothetical protein AST99_05265 [Formosa algae]